MIWIKRSLLIVFITAVITSYAEARQVSEFVLKNGIKVIVSEDHKAPLATFQVWYRVGSKDEPGGKSGISHLLEHMMFKGTRNMGPKEFSRLIQKNGGIDNAFTTRDYTMYYETLPSDRLELAIRLESDRIKNLLLRESDVIYERSVVMEERRLRYEDDPQNLLYEEVVATALKVHPYRRPIIGWMSELKSITRDDLVRYYKRFYCAENVFIVVAGDVYPEKVFSAVQRYFSDVPACEGKRDRAPEEPPQKGQKRVYLKKEARLPYILIAFHVPTFPSPDAPALELLAAILSGKSGRLYNALVRQQKMAIDAFASFSGLRLDPFLFFVGAIATSDTDIKALEKSLKSVLQEVKERPPSDRELQKARNQLESSLIMGQDSIFFQAELLGMFQVLGDWRLKDRYIESLQSVTPEDISRVAKKYLTEDNSTVGILIPIQSGQ